MSEKIYALLLRLYPKHFRRMYGEEALQLVRDRVRDERGLLAKARLWWDLLADFAISAPREYGYVPAQLAGAAVGQRVSGVPSFWILEDEPMRVGTWVWASVLSLTLVALSAVLMDHAGGHPLGSFASSARDAARHVQWTPKQSGSGMPQGDSDVELVGSGPRMHTPGAPSSTGSTGNSIQVVAAEQKLEFDVASVKQSKSDDGPNANIPFGPGDMYVPTGGNFVAKNMPLSVYIMFAYKMSPGEAAAMDEEVPGWVATGEKYDITAKTDKHDVTKDEMRTMTRALLAERFKLVMHRETRQMPMYGLVLAKPGTLGPKLVAHSASEPCDTALQLAEKKAPPTDTVAGGFPKVCGGVMGLPESTPGMTKLGARNISIGQLAQVLPGLGNLGRPVQDQTGLSGTYDFVLELVPVPRLAPTDAANDSGTSMAGPGLEQALKQQLGLKLESKKAGVDIWVVDHVERPTPN